jgi:hypothetical protein
MREREREQKEMKRIIYSMLLKLNALINPLYHTTKCSPGKSSTLKCNLHTGKLFRNLISRQLIHEYDSISKTKCKIKTSRN